MRRRFGLYVLLCVLVLSVAIVLGEVLLRAIGFKPWRYTQLDANEPTMHEPDPVLGWRNKKGVYIVPPYHPSGEAIHVTFLDNGQRRTTERYTSVTEGEILIVGGSYTQGWAISDHETFPWKLEDYYPFLTVLNYGTGGYGSYQSLLKLLNFVKYSDIFRWL